VRWAGLAILGGYLGFDLLAGMRLNVAIVWTVLALIHAMAILRLTAPDAPLTGFAFGLAAFAMWALLCLMTPALPTSNAPSGLAIALAGLAAVLWTPRETPRPAAAAGLTAAMTVAFLSTVYIDTVLPHLGRWVTTSAPPSSLYRLVDSVGLYMLGAIVAIAAVVTLSVRLRPRPAGSPTTPA
jgi:hypothetical protein